VKTGGLIRTLRPHGAGGTEVAPVHEPDARQRDIRRFGQAGHDAAEEFSNGPDLGQLQETFLERVELRRAISSQVHDSVIAELANEGNVKVKSGWAFARRPAAIISIVETWPIKCRKSFGPPPN